MAEAKGFTLLEVLIAILILAMLSALTAGSIQRSLRVKSKIQEEIDVSSKTKNAFRLIERDINLAFHYRDLNSEIYQGLNSQQNGQTAPGASANNPYTGQPNPNGEMGQETPPKKLTHFIGKEDSMHFTALNNIRMSRDVQESDQAEVGYYIETCSGRKSFGREKAGSSKCLFRRISPIIDDDVTQGGNAIPLLENVVEFKLKYFGKGKQDWVSNWRTDDGGDAVTKDHFPQAVDVTLVTKERGREISLSSIVPIHFPNNPPERTNPGGLPGQEGQNPNPNQGNSGQPGGSR